MTRAHVLEVYFVAMFEKVKDEHGQPLDISKALPTLCSVINYKDEQFSDSKYGFLGGPIMHATVRYILAKHYLHLDDAELDVLAKKFHGSLHRLYKALSEEIHLKDYVHGSQLTDAINRIIGVLVCFYGINIVAEFIEPAVMHVIRLETKASAPLATSNNLLRQLIKKQNGYFEDTASSFVDGLWHVELKCRMTDQSTLFTHARNAASKQMAKTAASSDILNFLKHHREQLYAPASVPGVCYKLPIGSQSPAAWESFNDATHMNSSHVKVKEEEE